MEPHEADFPTIRRDPADMPTTPSAPPAPSVQGTAFGRYRLLQELGRGGMGVVWKAWDGELRRVVALKQVSGASFGGEQVERFAREARVAARLRHPAIVAVHDVGAVGEQPYFTSDFIDGRPLSAIAGSPPPPRQAAEIVARVAEALAHAHREGIVHRDVKPANVLLDAQGLPYVADFGLARDVSAGASAGLTASGDLLGTPSYMSPEQADGRVREVGPASDQFSLGVVLYELLTGRRPFEGATIFSILDAVRKEDPAAPTRIVLGVPRDLETICLKAMEKDAAQRYADLDGMAADLRRWLAGEPILARALSRRERWARWAARRRTVLLPSAIAVLLAVGWGVYTLASRSSAEDSERERERLSSAAAISDALAAKTEAVSEVLSRWSRLGETMAEMERVAYDGRLTEEERRVRTAPPWERVEAFLEATPHDGASQATARALAGWARRIAGFPDEGEAWMREAAGLDLDVPFGDMMEALVVFSDYCETQPQAPTTFDAGGAHIGEPAPDSPKRLDLRMRLEGLLARIEKARVWGRRAAEQFGAAVRAIRAAESGRLDEVEAPLAVAIDAPNLALFRVGLLEARARVRYRLNRYEEALADTDLVLKAHPDWARVYELRGTIRMARALTSGGDARPGLDEAIAEFDGAVERGPRYAPSHHGRAIALTCRATAEEAAGDDPRASLRKAIASSDAAVGLQPDNHAARATRGYARWLLATAEGARGGNGRALLLGAIEDYDAAIAAAPASHRIRFQRAWALHLAAESREAHGQDPSAERSRAIADLDALPEAWGGAVDARLLRADLLKAQARRERKRGEDARATYDAAIAACDAAERAAPGRIVARTKRGKLLGERAAAGRARGEDIVSWLDRALVDFDSAVEEDPKDPARRSDRCHLATERAEAEMARKGDPAAWLEKAVADGVAATKGDPRNAIYHYNLANARTALGDWTSSRGADPRVAYAAAIEDLGRAIEADDGFVEAWLHRGQVRSEVARVQHALKIDPGDTVVAAVSDLERALALQPTCWMALWTEGTLYESVGAPRRALEAYERALDIVGAPRETIEKAIERTRAAAEKR